MGRESPLGQGCCQATHGLPGREAWLHFGQCHMRTPRALQCIQGTRLQRAKGSQEPEPHTKLAQGTRVFIMPRPEVTRSAREPALA